MRRTSLEFIILPFQVSDMRFYWPKDYFSYIYTDMKKKFLSALAVLVASAVSAAGQKDYVTYEDYGAVGDGKHDDQAAIIAAHAAANKAGLPVRAADDKTYYIGGGKALAIIKTDTDWGTARFIIDDVKLEDLNKPVFVVASRLKSYKLDGLKTLKKGQKRLAMKFPQKSLVLVANKEKNVYIRKGLNRNKGHFQQELLLVEKNGRLYDRALPIFDFDKVTDCTVFPVDEHPLTVKAAFSRQSPTSPARITVTTTAAFQSEGQMSSWKGLPIM